ncbi:F-box associated interaction domain containing protein [Trema orientale]|uniref:F-box associated interaction domain containing protein n=1 Tax=Trema orientale TaxID=63057 RepID=A0A2P5EIW4_TREOI|nr:F-box associated interaction domain containing protein [Trema orientale]
MDSSEHILVLSETGEGEEEIYWIDQEGKSCSFSLELLPELKGSAFHFKCCCNGLLLYQFESSGQAFLINPLREEVLFLRERPSEFSISGAETFKRYCGLGAGGITGQYKVVMVECQKRKQQDKCYYNNIAHIMTLGSTEWRVIQSVPNWDCEDSPVFENGFLYWMQSREERKPQQLLAFDVENEIFSTMETPSQVDWMVDLAGYLGLVHASSEGLRVWFATSHNNQGKITTWGVRDPIVVHHDGKQISSHALRLLGFWKDSKVLIMYIETQKYFFSYDFAFGNLTVIEYPRRATYEYKTFKGSSLSISEFHASSEMVYVPPGQMYNTRRSDLIKRVD